MGGKKKMTVTPYYNTSHCLFILLPACLVIFSTLKNGKLLIFGLEYKYVVF